MCYVFLKAQHGKEKFKSNQDKWIKGLISVPCNKHWFIGQDSHIWAFLSFYKLLSIMHGSPTPRLGPGTRPQSIQNWTVDIDTHTQLHLCKWRASMPTACTNGATHTCPSLTQKTVPPLIPPPPGRSAKTRKVGELCWKVNVCARCILVFSLWTDSYVTLFYVFNLDNYLWKTNCM